MMYSFSRTRPFRDRLAEAQLSLRVSTSIDVGPTQTAFKYLKMGAFFDLAAATPQMPFFLASFPEFLLLNRPFPVHLARALTTSSRAGREPENGLLDRSIVNWS